MRQNSEPHNSTHRAVARLSVAGLVAGGWLIGAPFLLQYESEQVRLWDIVVGAALVALAWGRRAMPHGTNAYGWWSAGLGAALVSGLWIFRYETTQALWNDLIVGLVVFGLGLLSGSMHVEPPAKHAGASGPAPHHA